MPWSLQILLELVIDDVRREQQGALSKLRQLLRLDPRVGLRRRIDDDDLVGAVDEVLRDGLGPRRAEDVANEFLLLGDVLEIDRRNDGDSRFEQLLDVLASLLVSAPGGIVVRQAIDQADLRATREDRGHVDDGRSCDVHRRNVLERPQHLRDLGG